MRVITYQSPSGATIHLTPDQVAELERWGVWPRDAQGREYCTVSHSEHAGTPTYSGAELARFVCNEVEARKAGEGKDFRGELVRTREQLEGEG